MQNGISKWKVLALIAGVWVVADQVTKFLAVEHLTAAFRVAGARDFPDKLRAFVEQKNLLERGLADTVPVSVRDAVLARAMRLTPDARKIAELAWVGGGYVNDL